MRLWWGQEQTPKSTEGSPREHCNPNMGQTRHGVAVCTAVCMEEHAGRALSLCQSTWLVKLMIIILSQRALAVVSSKKKAMSSASPVASALTGSGTATQTELPRKQPSRSQAAGCAQVFCQCLRAAVSTTVGGVARQRNCSA